MIYRGSLMQRVRRMISSVQGGENIFALLSRPEIQLSFIEAAKRGEPPQLAVVDALSEIPEAHSRGGRQFAGLCLSALLEQAGLVKWKAGVRLPANSLFATGTIYRLPARN